MFAERDLRQVDAFRQQLARQLPESGIRFAHDRSVDFLPVCGSLDRDEMPVFQWGHAFEAFADLEREFDRLLQSAAQAARVGRLFPPLNLYELPDRFVLLAQIPGVKAEELDLQVADRQLTLRGERKLPDGVSETQFRRRERIGGHWERTVSLPDRVDEDAIEAEFRNGLLVLQLPKLQAAASRQIDVVDASENVDEGGKQRPGLPAPASQAAANTEGKG